MKNLSTALGALLVVAAFVFGIYVLHVVREKKLIETSKKPIEYKKKNDSKAENEAINRQYEQAEQKQN